MTEQNESYQKLKDSIKVTRAERILEENSFIPVINLSVTISPETIQDTINLGLTENEVNSIIGKTISEKAREKLQ